MIVQNFIDPTAKLGKNVQVWHYTYIGKNVIIGDGTKIGSLVHIDSDVKIGKNCKIEGGAYIPPGTIIGDHVFIGPNVTITNDRNPDLMKSDWKPKPVIIKDWAMIGAAASIRAGVVIGKFTIVGMAAVVLHSTDESARVVGNPAR